MRIKNLTSLSIILPTYNEKENIQILIPLLEELIKKNKLDAEIIVVDDSSPDGTAALATTLNKKYKNIKTIIRKNKEGIGAALAEGYNNATRDIIISMDADLSFNYKEIIKLSSKINEGYDLVLGSRHLNLNNYESKKFSTNIKRKISRFGNSFTNFLLGLNVHDFSANFRAIRKNVWNNIKTTEKANSFLLETIIATSSKGYKVTEIPVTFKERIYGESKVKFNFIKEAPKALLQLIKLKIINK